MYNIQHHVITFPVLTMVVVAVSDLVTVIVKPHEVIR